MHSVRLIFLSGLLLVSSYEAVAQNEVRDTTGFASSLYATPSELIRGQISGVRVSLTDGAPGSAVDVTVRGQNSFRTDKSPLWIVDGVIINSSLSDKFGSMREFSDLALLPSFDNLAFLSSYDIESIEVLKNATATAIYGSQGANGVIIVKTKSPAKDGKMLDLRTNVGMEIGEGKVGVSHNHYLRFNGSTDNVGFYVSGFYKEKGSPVPNSKSRYFGGRLGFDTSANRVVQFGMKAQFGAGDVSSNISTSDIGFKSLSSDFDNTAKEIRLVSSVFLNFNLTRTLSWKNTAGVDYEVVKRYLWYGSETELGGKNSGISVIPASNLLRENFNSSLNYSQYFGKNHLSAILGFDQQIRSSRYNVLQGSNFFTEILRAKGLSLSGAENLPLNYHDISVSQLAGHASISYDYNSIVGVDASFRADFTPKYFDAKPVYYPAGQVYFNIDKLISPPGILSQLSE